MQRQELKMSWAFRGSDRLGIRLIPRFDDVRHRGFPDQGESRRTHAFSLRAPRLNCGFEMYWAREPTLRTTDFLLPTCP